MVAAKWLGAGLGAGRLEADALLADHHVHRLTRARPGRGPATIERPALERDDDAVGLAPRDGAGQEVRPPEEAGDEGGGRAAIDLLGPPDLLDAPALHHHHAVGQDERLRLVVGDEDHRGAEPLLQPLELHAHLVAQERVEVRERLVEQQHARAR